MNDHRAVIEQQPAALGCALLRERNFARFFFHAITNMFAQGAELAVAGTIRQDKKIRDDGIRPQIKQNDMLTFALFDDIDDKAREF